jgi:DNA-binding response OmpR family regulator
MTPNKKVLITEDEAPIRNILSDKLTEAGYEILSAGDGKTGLEIALSERPKLILLDINLPVMDGMSMLKNLRQDEYGKNVEVVLLTNSNEFKMLAEALKLGAHDYLVKSDWSLDDVVKLVNAKMK